MSAPASPRCSHCGTTESRRFFESAISTVCAQCMSYFIETTDVDDKGEDSDSDTDDACSEEDVADTTVRSSQSLPGSRNVGGLVSGSQTRGGERAGEVHVKSKLQICAVCCRGPAQEGLQRQFVLPVDKQALRSCSACHCAYFCSKECQRKGWALHKIPCQALSKRNKIPCVSLTDNCQQLFLDPDDPSFAAATPSRIMHLAGIPLAVLPLESEAGSQNQWCTFLLVDPVTDVVPVQFEGLRKMLLCRLDRMPITPEHVHQLRDFIYDIMDHSRVANKASFIRFLTSQHKQGLSW